MSQQAKPGRKTPLSLGIPKVESNEKSHVRTGKATVSLEKLPTELPASKQPKNGTSADEKVENKSENGENNAQSNGSTTKKDTGNGVSKDSSNENSKPTENPKQGNEKAKVSNEKSKEDKVTVPKGNEKSIDKSKSSNEKTTPASDKKTSNEKEENVSQNASGATKIEDQKNDSKNNVEKEVRESVRQKQIREEKEKEENNKVTPSTPEKIESPKPKDKRKSEATPPTKTPKAGPSESLLAEKSLKGFNENLEEDSMKVTDSPMPTKDSKVLKMSHGPPTRPSRVNRLDKLDDASLVVNLSTVSEQSNESARNNTPVERNYSLRHITGRRSTRPLREMSFDYRTRESYNKIQNDFDDSSASTNVTHWSDSPRDNFRSSGGIKRNIDEEIVGSPKRSRFDFGLLDLVSSPVTKLRARFSRANISTSTPNKLILSEAADKTEDIPSGIEAENFVAEEDAPQIELVTDNEEKKSEMDIDMVAEEEAPIEIREGRKSRCAVM